MTKPTRSLLLRSSMMTSAERSRGRFMRAPDGHVDPAPAADPAPAVDPAPVDPAPADPVAPPADPVGDGTVLGGEPPAADPADPAAPPEPEGAPEAYDLKAPEGSTLDTDALAIAEPVLRDLGLTNEQAQKLTDAYAQIVPKVAERMQSEQATQITAQRKAWADEAKADPEIGGANWKASITASAKALDRLGAPAGSPFRELLNVTGLGNHPEMIRMFSKVGAAIGEDSDFVRGEAAPTEKNAARILYPNDKPKGA
jgi:hypothetical protein